MHVYELHADLELLYVRRASADLGSKYDEILTELNIKRNLGDMSYIQCINKFQVCDWKFISNLASVKSTVILADIAYDGQGYPIILSKLAWLRLQYCLNEYGVSVKCLVEERDYEIFFPTQHVDAIILEASEFSNFLDGSIMEFYRYELNEKIIGSRPIFTLHHTRSRVFVTQVVVDLVTENQLTGFLFQKIWSSVDGPTDVRKESVYPTGTVPQLRVLRRKKREAVRRLLESRPPT